MRRVGETVKSIWGSPWVWAAASGVMTYCTVMDAARADYVGAGLAGVSAFSGAIAAIGEFVRSRDEGSGIA